MTGLVRLEPAKAEALPKRIKVPAPLLIMDRVWKLQFNLGAHEGQVEFDPVTMTKWKYESEKGGWTYQGSLKDVVRPTNTHAVIPDEGEASRDPSVLPEDPVLSSLHRVEEGISILKSQGHPTWNYTMLSDDGRTLKIGESRKGKPGQMPIVEHLKKRYRTKENGGPSHYVAHQQGNELTEAAAKQYLRKCGVEPSYGEEYFPSHGAIKALRTYGLWCLGPCAEEGGLLPAIKEIPPEPEQGFLDI